ncbi:uncharacterized protein LTR77_007479 [Saxophila tyrrhenica]|uniref:Fe2OG dioxygenase domain-containing protein n=1 Tax=Saxophila tyrrhenica TaxID=1690608 RepID=A0AAV9P8T9_9PEZI|nr:hypothetical protein LTR77_007479 [Saxophila tyrrhenica]
MQIPTVNLSPTNPHASHQLLSAATTYGFVFIENNELGIPTADIDNLFSLSKEFFASPLEVKQDVAIGSNAAGANYGWLSRGVEKLDPGPGGQRRADVKEALNIGAPISGQLQQPLPTPLRAHLNSILSFQSRCHELCLTLLHHLAHALEIPPSWFSEKHDPALGRSGTVLRLLYYPALPAEEVEQGVDVRAGAHSDFGSLTLLFQRPGQPGLEIWKPTPHGSGEGEGEWVSVPVDPKGSERAAGEPLPILVNIGDLLEDWTGGLLRSTRHRVVFPTTSSPRPGEEAEEEGEGSDRYSIAYFCHPLDDATLDPVPSEVVREHAERTGRKGMREGMTARGHLMERLGATYSIK